MKTQHLIWVALTLIALYLTITISAGLGYEKAMEDCNSTRVDWFPNHSEIK